MMKMEVLLKILIRFLLLENLVVVLYHLENQVGERIDVIVMKYEIDLYVGNWF